ncbi:MAM domain-containing protein 2 [Suncus etruscus]|uniref:MAM domain-containing protein 2 n=1 Tax=Suncus etruscus TaxID=109475 RepID=UPI0021103DAA|nr:MAM domain-containing protein 2 [Suncus etruscus]
MLFWGVLLAVEAWQLAGSLRMSSGSCTFEVDTCDFDSESAFQPWILNEEGHCIYVDTSFAKQGEKAILISSDLEAEEWSCLRLVYQIISSSRAPLEPSQLNLYVRFEDENFDRLLWSTNEPSDSWLITSLDLQNSPKKFKSMEKLPFSAMQASCNFETDFCNFHQDKEGWGWTRVKVRPNMYRSGDHTSGFGYYLLANTKFTSQSDYIGRLYGPSLPGNLPYCLRFYYAIYGFLKMSDTLAVYIFEENHVVQEKIWSVLESPRGVWIQTEITFKKPMPTKESGSWSVKGLLTGEQLLPNLEEVLAPCVLVTTIMNLLLYIRGLKLAAREPFAAFSLCKSLWDCGLVALDDIAIEVGSCSSPGKHLSLPGECTFEKDECAFTQEKQDRSSWHRRRGGTPTSYTGPRGDHTTGVGHYMYIEASHMVYGQKARLLSKPLRGVIRKHCLIFFYHMYGAGTGLLSVYLKREGQESLLWRRRGEQSVSWLRGLIEYSCDRQHQIVFEAIRGVSIRSDIAIDDVKFQAGPCEEIEDTTQQSSGYSEDLNEIEY